MDYRIDWKQAFRDLYIQSWVQPSEFVLAGQAATKASLQCISPRCVLFAFSEMNPKVHPRWTVEVYETPNLRLLSTLMGRADMATMQDVFFKLTDVCFVVGYPSSEADSVCIYRTDTSEPLLRFEKYTEVMNKGASSYTLDTEVDNILVLYTDYKIVEVTLPTTLHQLSQPLPLRKYAVPGSVYLRYHNLQASIHGDELLLCAQYEGCYIINRNSGEVVQKLTAGAEKFLSQAPQFITMSDQYLVTLPQPRQYGDKDFLVYNRMTDTLQSVYLGEGILQFSQFEDDPRTFRLVSQLVEILIRMNEDEGMLQCIRSGPDAIANKKCYGHYVIASLRRDADEKSDAVVIREVMSDRVVCELPLRFPKKLRATVSLHMHPRGHCILVRVPHAVYAFVPQWSREGRK